MNRRGRSSSSRGLERRASSAMSVGASSPTTTTTSRDGGGGLHLGRLASSTSSSSDNATSYTSTAWTVPRKDRSPYAPTTTRDEDAVHVDGTSPAASCA